MAVTPSLSPWDHQDGNFPQFQNRKRSPIFSGKDLQVVIYRDGRWRFR
ncbi:MAG: hypothetical protein RMY34_31740 [Aulosira sp. DedQUE10]|nr:hypothetical protein [Aulosira sp. DedQUE10]